MSDQSAGTSGAHSDSALSRACRVANDCPHVFVSQMNAVGGTERVHITNALCVNCFALALEEIVAEKEHERREKLIREATKNACEGVEHWEPCPDDAPALLGHTHCQGCFDRRSGRK